MATIGLDFDGVLHSYEHGWGDGDLYGTLLPGAKEALERLMADYAVVVMTARAPLYRVANWITSQTGILAVVDPGDIRFWTRTDRILVTCRKVPAFVYVDDRGYRFTGWDQLMADVDALLAMPGNARAAEPGKA